MHGLQQYAMHSYELSNLETGDWAEILGVLNSDISTSFASRGVGICLGSFRHGRHFWRTLNTWKQQRSRINLKYHDTKSYFEMHRISSSLSKSCATVTMGKSTTRFFLTNKTIIPGVELMFTKLVDGKWGIPCEINNMDVWTAPEYFSDVREHSRKEDGEQSLLVS